MDLRCLYASTHCPNARSVKISGELHRFCLFHRRNANAAQRRWKQKKLQGGGSEDETQKRQPLKRRSSAQACKPATLKRLWRSDSSIYHSSLQVATPSAAVIALPPMFSLTDELPLITDEDIHVLSSLILDEDGQKVGVQLENEWWDAWYQTDIQSVGVIV